MIPTFIFYARRCILLAIMSPRDEVFQAVPFDATSDAKEPLIATGDAEEDNQGLEERDLLSLKLSLLLLGLIVGFFLRSFTLRAIFLAIDFGMKSNTAVILLCLLWSVFTVASLFLIVSFIRNVGRSEDLFEGMILQLECQFGVGVLSGICLTWTILDVLLGTRAYVVVDPFAISTMVFGFIWYKVTMASATDSKPSSTRPSTAEQTMMTV
jgi:hypothetical protein